VYEWVDSRAALPQSFTVSDALLLEEYLFVSLLELYDWAQSE